MKKGIKLIAAEIEKLQQVDSPAMNTDNKTSTVPLYKVLRKEITPGKKAIT